MNKLNQKEEITQIAAPLDKRDVSHTLHKETKKLTRLPFYKLEELKKLEEKKTKQRHKINKKEDIIIPNSQIYDKSEKTGKKKRIILKKVKEETVKTKVEEVLNNKKDSTNENPEVKNEIKQGEINKHHKLKKMEKSQLGIPPNHSGNSLQTLKYSADGIIHKKIKLSRKQRKLQEAENTLGSFLSKEDKSTFYQNSCSQNFNSNKFVINEDSHPIINDKNFASPSLNISTNITNQNVNVSNLNLNTTLKKTDNNINLTMLGKKKKRINKFKKAVYKSRFKKKQFIFNNVFNLENENSNVIANEFIDKQNKNNVNADLKLNEDIVKTKNNNSTVTYSHTAEIFDKSNTGLSLNSNFKPNFIEKTNFYSQDHKQGLNNLPVNSNIQTIPMSSQYNLSTINNNPLLYNPYFYNHYQSSFLYNYPVNYPQYSLQSYPINMNIYHQTFNGQAYNNCNNSNGFYNKFNMNFMKIPTENCNSDKNLNLFSNINPQTQTNNLPKNINIKDADVIGSRKKKKKKKNKYTQNSLNKFDQLDKRQIQDLNNCTKKEFMFEVAEKSQPQDDHNNFKESNNDKIPGEFKNFIKSTYHIDKDIANLNGIELNNYLKEHTMLKKVDLKNLQKIADKNTINTYIKNFEGVLPEVNLNKRIIREYVDQMLDNDLDKKFGDFIVKMRDMYHKKKQANPLKAKKRFVVGMKEIEKHIRLDEVKCLFIVPNIEKVEGENSLDDRIYKIFKDCEMKNIPKIFGMNKFKLGKLSRKKHSCVSMLAFVNVEGFEREFKEIIEFGEKFRIKFYENYKSKKESFKDNRFINSELFNILEKPSH